MAVGGRKKWTPPQKVGGIPWVSTRFSLSMEMSRLTRDGTAEPVSRDQILRRERGQRNIHFPWSADHEQDWQPYPVDKLWPYLVHGTRCMNSSTPSTSRQSLHQKKMSILYSSKLVSPVSYALSVVLDYLGFHYGLCWAVMLGYINGYVWMFSILTVHAKASVIDYQVFRTFSLSFWNVSANCANISARQGQSDLQFWPGSTALGGPPQLARSRDVRRGPNGNKASDSRRCAPPLVHLQRLQRGTYGSSTQNRTNNKPYHTIPYRTNNFKPYIGAQPFRREPKANRTLLPRPKLKLYLKGKGVLTPQEELVWFSPALCGGIFATPFLLVVSSFTQCNWTKVIGRGCFQRASAFWALHLDGNYSIQVRNWSLTSELKKWHFFFSLKQPQHKILNGIDLRV